MYSMILNILETQEQTKEKAGLLIPRVTFVVCVHRDTHRLKSFKDRTRK